MSCSSAVNGTLMTECDFRVADMPHASPFELHIRVAVRSVRARVAILAVAQRVPATAFLPSRNA
jgi:hypothetical protein